MVRPSGRLVAIEIKTERGKLSEDQRMFLAMINAGGGYARVARSVAEANEIVDQAIDTAVVWTGKTYCE
jgi:predicted NUDIX family phosphoesterase